MRWPRRPETTTCSPRCELLYQALANPEIQYIDTLCIYDSHLSPLCLRELLSFELAISGFLVECLVRESVSGGVLLARHVAKLHALERPTSRLTGLVQHAEMRCLDAILATHLLDHELRVHADLHFASLPVTW